MNADDARAKRKKISDTANQMAARDYNTYFRTDELGREASFESGADIFERIWRLFRRLNEDSLILLSRDGLQRVERFLSDISEALARIQHFRLSQSSNALSDRNSYLSSLDGMYRDVLRECPELALLGQPTGDAEKRLLESTKIAARLAELESSTTDMISRQRAEAQDLLEKMRQASGKVAITSYSSFFESEARESKKAAYLWLITTVAVLLIVGPYLWWLVFVWAPKVSDLSLTQVVQAGGAKLALFSVLIYLLSWCGRNYRAQWHLVVVNRHRANALNALEAFSNSAKNDATREAILIHASSAIFSQVQTGFVPDQAEAPATPSILEVVRGSNG